MRLLLLLLTIAMFPGFTSAQQKPNKKQEEWLIKEGFRLYKSEMASWHGTDLFLQHYPDLVEKAGGYFSYESNNGTQCLFFSKGDAPQVLISFTFDDSFSLDRVKVQQQERDFTSLESDLFQIRKTALAEVNSDTLFRTYNNTSLNLIPVVEGKLKRVYVLTGPKVDGVVLLGNDYLLTFDAQNKLKDKQKMHQNIIPIEYSEDSAQEVSTMHTHLPSTGDYMTPTDICTLLLYGQRSNWKQHFTLSERYVSIWDIKERTLITLTKKAWEKIMSHSAEAKGKN